MDSSAHHLAQKHRSREANVLITFLVGLVIFGIFETARRWQGDFQPDLPIRTDAAALPLYAIYSLYRALLAYFLSLSFTLVFGYLAAKNRLAEQIIVPVLDIGQSIPVLGFLPGLVLGLVAVFPHSNVGIESACVLMIFTGQVWNMTFSFISSLKAVPTQLHEMSANVGMSPLRKLFRIELPCAATGLAWNSLMSMAGGWFFLTVCESFTLGSRSFRLPGLGSYMATAIERGDGRAVLLGILTMVAVILLMDFVVWRPVVAWTTRFRLTEQPESFQSIPFMSLLLRDSSAMRALADLIHRGTLAWSRLRRTPERAQAIQARRLGRVRRVSLKSAGRRAAKAWRSSAARSLERRLLFGLIGAGSAWVVIRVAALVSVVRWVEWREIFVCTLFTGFRVAGALVLSTLWAVPAGIAIGLSPRLTRWLQPVVQLGASFPAPMLYPLALALFQTLHLELSVSSGLLMMLGVQWYVLFNVLAGATGISQDLRDSFRLIGVGGRRRWTQLYIPSVFPSLVTGWVTAAGGAWNASIVAEYVLYRGETLQTRGLGSMISQATAAGNFNQLTACLIAMVVVVVGINRGFWSRAYQLAETRFRFER